MSQKYDPKEVALNYSDLRDINNLLVQLSDDPKRITYEDFRRLKSQPNFSLWIARDKQGRVVAMASLIIYETLLKKVGVIEDVVVDAEHRGKGLAKQAVLALINLGISKGLSHIDLTSNPMREAANKLYLGLGFKKRETNCYRLNLRT